MRRTAPATRCHNQVVSPNLRGEQDRLRRAAMHAGYVLQPVASFDQANENCRRPLRVGVIDRCQHAS